MLFNLSLNGTINCKWNFLMHHHPPDTAIILNKSFELLLEKKIVLKDTIFSNPRLLKNKTKVIPLNITLNSRNLRDMTLLISPNNKYFFACYTVEDGYVYVTLKDSIFHEVYDCTMISTRTGNVILSGLSNEEMSGKWNSNNKWVDSHGKVLIDPKSLKRYTIDD